VRQCKDLSERGPPNKFGPTKTPEHFNKGNMNMNMNMNIGRPKLIAVAIASLALGASFSALADSRGEPGRDSGKSNPLHNVYFGEEHLHSDASPDAFAFGTRSDANEAYRYAKGEAIKEAQSGKMIQKRTPYDFAAVTDHAEYLGMMPLLLDPKSPLQNSEIGKLLAKGTHESGEAAFQLIISSVSNGVPIPYLVRPQDNEIRMAETGRCGQQTL
jgi:hypothetical protein